VRRLATCEDVALQVGSKEGEPQDLAIVLGCRRSIDERSAPLRGDQAMGLAGTVKANWLSG